MSIDCSRINLPWEHIDTVLLDMDGTLLDLHFDNYFWLEFLPEYLAKQQNITLAQCKERLEKLSSDVKGTLDWYCLDYWSDLLSVDIPALKWQVSHKICFRPNTIEFLKSLQSRGKQVIMATNAHPKTLELKLLRADFKEYFDHLSSSHEIGFPKEELAYWSKLMERFDLKPQNCLFIDDSQSVLNMASEFGIGHILAIEQPDMAKKPVECAPYTGIQNFTQLI